MGSDPATIRQVIRSGLRLALLLLALAAPARAAERPPNVLFIAIDDLNDWVGCLGGHPSTATPNIDRLAARGVLFTNAHCAAPACNPSRVALLTGVAPSVSGVYHNDQPWRKALASRVTLPRRFRDHGYRSLGAGKIFHGRFEDRDSWTVWWPDVGTKLRSAKPAKRPLNGIPKSGSFDWGPIAGGDDAMRDTHTVGWAAGELGRKHEHPFFLAIGIVKPHLPWFAPKSYFDAVPIAKALLPKTDLDDLDDLPAAGLKMTKRGGDHARITAAAKWPHAVQAYLATIRYVDAQVGRLLKALDDGPNASATIVVLWSDHGWHLGEKEHWRKFALWEEATRVPLVIAVPVGSPGLPAGTKPGGRCARPVSLLDLYPTLTDLTGVPGAEKLSGRSLAPLLANPGAKRAEPAIVTHGLGNHAVRTERYRYIRYADDSEELYDHAVDPNEWENLAKDPATEGLRARLAEWLPKTDATDVTPAKRAKKRRR